MSTGTLLLRETATTSLNTIVEKSQHRKPPLPEYELRLSSGRLDFVLKSKPGPTSADEGFESDVDSVSIVSSDDSYIQPPPRSSKTQETDSANGSASSDSDTETPASLETNNGEGNESYNLVDCVCYADVKFPNLLVFVIKEEALVFRFDLLDDLQRFYVNFSALKAVANQKAYNVNVGTKYNLLQRTDNNGVTHIEITREPQARLFVPDRDSSKGVTLKTPETPLTQRNVTRNSNVANARPVRTNKNELSSLNYKSLTLNSVTKDIRKPVKDINQRQRNESLLLPDDNNRFRTLQAKTTDEMKYSRNPKPKLSVFRSASIENLLNIDEISKPHDTINKPANSSLKKVWNSAEDLLDSSPKRPERRRKPKGRAPPPPVPQHPKENASKEYQRLTTSSSSQNFAITTPKPTTLSNIFSNAKTKLTTYQQFKNNDVKNTSTLSRNTKLFSENSWTSSVPRLLKKPRSRSETRNFTPMAYRYIDTTQNYPSGTYTGRQSAYFHHNPSSTSTISNRLFGMSSKLKEFSAVQSDSVDGRDNHRWGSLGQLNYKLHKSDNSLKSVIKKDDHKRKNNEKKVTFSAYTTVQVV